MEEKSTLLVNSSITEPLTNFQQNADGNWLCDICGHGEKQKEDLLMHRILHFSNEHPRQCPICKKTFASPTSLRNHLTAVHTGIKKFRCKYCSRKFGWRAQLSIHENLHTGKGLHHCQICSKTFMTKWLLQRHLKIHERGIQRHRKDPNKFCLSPDRSVLIDNSDHNLSKLSSQLNKRKSAEISMSMQKSVESTKLHMCHECNEMFVSKEALAFHLLKHNSSKQKLNPKQRLSEALIDKDGGETSDTNLSNSEECMNEEFDVSEIDSKNKHLNAKHTTKGSLTSIVSKLHHKVDEKKKYGNEDVIEVQIVGSSDESYLPNEEENVQKTELTHDFNMFVQSNQHMSKSEDPFISGIVQNVLPHGASSNSSNVTTNHVGPGKDVDISVYCKETVKLQEQISFLKNELLEQKTDHARKLTSLNDKIDSLTNLISSQSLILNRIILGGKMSVNGTLDFCVHQNNDQ